MFAFFKGIQRVSVWNHDRKGDALVEFYLSVEKAYGLSFGNAEPVKDLDGLLFQSSVDTSVDVTPLVMRRKDVRYVRVHEHDHPVITRACHRKLMRRDLYVVVVSRLSSLSTNRNGQ